MRFRWMSTARLPLVVALPLVSALRVALVLPLALVLLAWPLHVWAQAAGQASGAPGTDESAPPISVQIAPPPTSVTAAMLGISSPLGAKAASGKPMFAEFVTEHHQSFSDGNRISRSTASCIYRDAQGRIRRESQLFVPGVSAGISASTYITIVDHQIGYGYVLDPQEMIAHRYELNAAAASYVARLSAQSAGGTLLKNDPAVSGASAVAAYDTGSSSRWHMHAFSAKGAWAAKDGASTSGATEGAGAPTTSGAGAAGSPGASAANSGADAPSTSGASAAGQIGSGFLAEDSSMASASTGRTHFVAAPNLVRTENLGEEIILGFRAEGTRVITTLPAGQIGNDRPIEIVSEQWFSPDLEVVMRSLHRDPWAGEFTTTITLVRRGDQPASLFRVPAAYKVIDAAREDEHHVIDTHGDHSPGLAPQ